MEDAGELQEVWRTSGLWSECSESCAGNILLCQRQTVWIRATHCSQSAALHERSQGSMLWNVTFPLYVALQLS